MQEKIYTIPINEAFENRCGCPLCRLSLKLEQDALEYVMGAAMMEPDVRIATNRQGFCRDHLSAMLRMKNRLGLSLILQTHLETVRKDGIPKKGLLGAPDCAKAAEKLSEGVRSCFVCARREEFLRHYYENTVYLWEEEEDFRLKLRDCGMLCLPHAEALLRAGAARLPKKKQPEFSGAILAKVSEGLDALQPDVDAFCKSFEYQNAGTPLSDGAKHAAERIADALCGAEEMQ